MLTAMTAKAFADK